MHSLQACLFKYITVSALSNYGLHGENDSKREGWRLCMEITLLIMGNHGKIMELCF